MSNKFKSSQAYGHSEKPKRKKPKTNSGTNSDKNKEYRHILMSVSIQYFMQTFNEELTELLSKNNHNLSELYHILMDKNPDKQLENQVYNFIIEKITDCKGLIFNLITQDELPKISDKLIESFYHIPNNSDDMFALSRQIDDEFSEEDDRSDTSDDLLDLKIQEYGVMIVISNIFNNQLIHFPCCKSKTDESRIKYACRPNNYVSVSDSNDFDELNVYCPYCGKSVLSVNEYEDLIHEMKSGSNSETTDSILQAATIGSIYTVFLKYLEDDIFDFEQFTLADIYDAFTDKQLPSELMSILYKNIENFYKNSSDSINEIFTADIKKFELPDVKGLNIHFEHIPYESFKSIVDTLIDSERFKNLEDAITSSNLIEGFLALLYSYSRNNK